MADDRTPAKKVVKRVVKKSVATPAKPTTLAKPKDEDAAPQLRYGRQVTTAPKAGATASATKTVAKPSRAPRPKIAVASKVKGAQKAVTSRGSSAASGVAGAVRSGSARVGETISDRFFALHTWRMPHWDPMAASIFTGAVVGLVAVGFGLLSKIVFNDLRGVSSGGGRWGSLTFVVVAFIAFVLGELLLTGFGVAQARLTSFLGVVLTIVAMLGLFLGLADTVWGLVIVPAVAVVSYVLSRWLLDLAETNAVESD
ncbi:MAG: hypothetical protein ABIN55_12765 [Aeromicrobium sp.]